MDGPIASRRAPSGTLAATPFPASRPPGSPPVPARNVPVVDGLTVAQTGTARLTDSTAVRTAAATVAAPAGPRAGRARATRTSVRAASTARAGAIARRYWYPLTGQ